VPSRREPLRAQPFAGFLRKPLTGHAGDGDEAFAGDGLTSVCGQRDAADRQGQPDVYRCTSSTSAATCSGSHVRDQARGPG
jgi:hypothetical protein